MNIIKHIPTYLLAIVYLVFGLNYFLNFIPTPPQTPSNATTFAGLLYTTGYLAFVKVLEVVFAILLFVPKTRALGLLLIAPITVNILLFEVFMLQQAGLGILLVVLNAIAIFQHKEKYMNIVKPIVAV
jgi:putative oxidoreductase